MNVEALEAYLAPDRREAIARQQDLPHRAHGAVLFADISGFTPLAESLAQELGPRYGAEELSRHLNQVFEGLISQVERFGGSVISFSGDAITCWFDQDTDGLRATASGLAMQPVMGSLGEVRLPSGKTRELALKVAVATGPVRRFIVGKPEVQYLDVLAGATLDRMAAAEHQARKGEVVVGPEVAATPGERLQISEWRFDEDSGNAFAVVKGLQGPVEDTVSSEKLACLTQQQVKRWLLPVVYQRVLAGQETLLTELRPTVALFVRFSGLDYDGDEQAGAKLDEYIQWVQEVVTNYEGALLDITVGDKGSYLYITFGALIAHENDLERALQAGLELRTPPAQLGWVSGVQIGISQGIMWAGAYGGASRRTYAVLGDGVNLAARLMLAAQPGQVLVSGPETSRDGSARRKLPPQFGLKPLSPLRLKGKSSLVEVYSLLDSKPVATQTVAETETLFSLPMVGREQEMAQVVEKLELALKGRGQVAGICGEAGVGKSRLIAEVRRLAQERGLTIYGGECLSYATSTSYLVWQNILRGLLGLNPDDSTEIQIARLTRQLETLGPEYSARLPLLGVLLGLPVPENDLTRSLDYRLQKSLRESTVVDLVRGQGSGAGGQRIGVGGQESGNRGQGLESESKLTNFSQPPTPNPQPLLFVLEDCQWLDPLSQDLLIAVAQGIKEVPVLLVLAYRPVQSEGEAGKSWFERLMALPHSTLIQLKEFTPQQSEKLVELKLNQLFGPQVKLPGDFVERISERGQGNPFYLEELVNLLRDRQLNLQDAETIQTLELPSSVQTLILSRLDRLEESQKSVIKVASVVGRTFKAAWLWGAYPALGRAEQVKGELSTLSRLELTPQIAPEPELEYLFRQILTRDVTYESLAMATRAELHEMVGAYVEREYQGQLDQYLDILAYHYERSNNDLKAVYYLARSAARSARLFANQKALQQYETALARAYRAGEATNPGIAQLLTGLGEVQAQVADFEAALKNFGEALDKTEDVIERAGVQQRRAEVLVRATRFGEAIEVLERGEEELAIAAMSNPTTGVLHKVKLAWAQLTELYSTVMLRQSNYEMALHWAEYGLRILDSPTGRQSGAALIKVKLYQALAAAQAAVKQMAEAQQSVSKALRLLRQHKDPLTEGQLRARLAILAMQRYQYRKASQLFRQALPLVEKTGARDRLANVLLPGGQTFLYMGQLEEAQVWLERGLQLAMEVSTPFLTASGNYLVARVYKEIGQWQKALDHYAASTAIAEKHGLWDRFADYLGRQGELYGLQGDFEQAEKLLQQALMVLDERKLPASSKYFYFLPLLTQLYCYQGKFEQAARCLRQSKAQMSPTPTLNEIYIAFHIAEWYGLKALCGQPSEELGRAEEIHQKVLEGLAFLENIDMKLGLPEVYRTIGLVELVQNRPEEAVKHFKKGLSLARSSGQVLEIARLQAYLGRIDLKGDRPEKRQQARRELKEAATLFAKLGASPELEQVKLLLG